MEDAFATLDTPRSIRVRLGLTQAQLARRARLSQPVVSRIENGGNAMLEKIRACARACDQSTALYVAAMERRAGQLKGGALVRKHHGWRKK